VNPALIASLAAAGLLAGWPQRAVITRLGVSPPARLAELGWQSPARGLELVILFLMSQMWLW